MSGAPGKHWEQDKEATVYVGNLDERVTDDIVWELMINVGRVQKVHLPKDRVTMSLQGYGFVTFATEEDAEYAVRIMNQVKLWGKPIRVKKASADKSKQEGIGAELFIGNLDPMVDERSLHMTFVRFGPLAANPKVQRDENNLPKGFGFVSFTTFEAADEAIKHMNGQFLMNREISVQYAFKKDGQGGARHGDDAERAIAAAGIKNNVEAPVQHFPNTFMETQSAIPATPTAYGGYSTPNAMQGGAGPTGLPPRPPSGAPGYPQTGYAPPGFAPPPGFGAPPGFAPPPGFGAPPGMPPPAGFQMYQGR